MGKFPRKLKGYQIINVDYDEDSIYESESEAEDSIYVNIEEVERWQCVVCDEIHEEKDEAYHCCD